MGAEYLKVHLWWTVPPTLALWYFFRRLRSQRDVFKTNTLIAIAVVSTIPWDSYLVRNRIWSYPSTSVLGPTLFSIPLEEVYFFVCQTYITATLYNILSKPVSHVLLLPESNKEGFWTRWAGVSFFVAMFATSVAQLAKGGSGTYLALIIAWVSPFLALLWWTAGSRILRLPRYASIPPIALPTIYLWICDARALQRGTWVIETGTKLGLSLYGLELEEAIFFLLTNILVVFGMIACDYVFAVTDLNASKEDSAHPSWRQLLESFVMSPDDFSHSRLRALKMESALVKKKSKSFWSASMLFEGPLRLDLIALYGWCRVTDDLIDDVKTLETARINLQNIEKVLDDVFQPASTKSSKLSEIPQTPELEVAASTLRELPISREPLEELLIGYRLDLAQDPSRPSLATDYDLLFYASCVASSVAELCVQLAFARYGSTVSSEEKRKVIEAARKMGEALQLVNIARDVPEDARNGRCYLPGVSVDDITSERISRAELTAERRRLLAMGRALAVESRPSIERLPWQVRGGMRAACDVYLSIGDAVEKALDEGRTQERARVSKWQRARIAWRALETNR